MPTLEDLNLIEAYLYGQKVYNISKGVPKR